MKKILFTGGGTAGHVTPNLALIDKFQQAGWQTAYVGSAAGIEKDLIAKKNIPYFSVASGKLRRYFSWQNFFDPLKIFVGIVQASWLCYRLKPCIVFSKGGFVAFPTVVAAWLNRIPVVVHESDFSPGLANKISFPFATAVCVTFAEGAKFFRNKEKVKVTGTPIRDALFQGSADAGKAICGFTQNKPTILAFGGGQGAQAINKTLHALLPNLIEHFNIIHLCGKNKIDHTRLTIEGYKQFEYVDEELPHLMAAADIVISRAGANSIYELLALKKPHILIPLPLKASRGDQLDNAKHFAKLGLSHVLAEEQLNPAILQQAIEDVYKNRIAIQQKIADYAVQSGTDTIFDLLDKLATQHKIQL